MWQTLRRAREYFDEPNEYRILRLVRDSTEISRTEIARICKISKPTVSEIVNRFLKGGFLESVGESESTERGGRKRELLRFKPDAGYVIGVDIRRTESAVAMTDLNAKILESKTCRYNLYSSSDSVLKGIAKAIESLLSNQSIEKCVGIGIGLPGVIDHKSGVIKVVGTLGAWGGVNLREYFNKKFGVPVFADNDVKARTLAEMLFGAGKHKHDQVFLWIGGGIGVGIVINGKLHRGITESAGEVGYNELRFGSAGKEFFPILYNGQRDYGAILSNRMIVNRYLAKSRNRKNATIESIVEAAANGEQLANQLMDEVALLTSIVCINLINMLNPQLLVLGGKLAESGTLLIDRVQQKVREDLLSVPAEAVQIVPSLLKKDGVVIGAAGLVLHDLFKPARYGRLRDSVELGQ
jgi:N-acetylglucosamine repressor